MRSILEREGEYCSVTNLPLRPDPTSVPADDPLYRDKSNTGSLEVRGRVKALKHTKQLRRVGHVEARAVVSHEIRPWVIIDHADLDTRITSLTSELPRVADQIF